MALPFKERGISIDWFTGVGKVLTVILPSARSMFVLFLQAREVSLLWQPGPCLPAPPVPPLPAGHVEGSVAGQVGCGGTVAVSDPILHRQVPRLPVDDVSPGD